MRKIYVSFAAAIFV